MLARGDALLAISYGGETQEILNLLETLNDWRSPSSRSPGSEVDAGEASDVALDVSVKKKLVR